MSSYNSSRETAAFNLAMPYLMRVNLILDSNYREFKNGNISMFAVNIKQLYRELYPWLVKNEKKNIDEITPMEIEFEQLSKISKLDKSKLWKKMERIELLMRVHFKELGMLMPKVSDPRYLFGKTQK